MHPQAHRRHEGGERLRARAARAPHGDGAAARRPARARGRASSRFQAVGVGGAHGRDGLPLSRTSASGRRPEPSGDGGAARRLHPLQPLRARVPRGPGQRRDRHGLPQRRGQDRVRPGRPDGRLDLRRLRRMRPGLPDRSADAGLGDRRRGQGPSRERPRGRQRLPLLRRRLPDHLPRQGRQDPLRHRAQRPGQREPAVRQGPLRLRLRHPPRPADQAADPQAGRAEGGRRCDRPGQPLHPLPRGDLGRGARRRGSGPRPHPRPRRRRRRSRASARPRARTRKPTSCRS